MCLRISVRPTQCRLKCSTARSDGQQSERHRGRDRVRTCQNDRHSDAREAGQQSGLQLTYSQCTRCNALSDIGGSANYLAMVAQTFATQQRPLGSRASCPKEAEMVKRARFLLGRPTTWTSCW